MSLQFLPLRWVYERPSLYSGRFVISRKNFVAVDISFWESQKLWQTKYLLILSLSLRHWLESRIDSFSFSSAKLVIMAILPNRFCHHFQAHLFSELPKLIKAMILEIALILCDFSVFIILCNLCFFLQWRHRWICWLTRFCDISILKLMIEQTKFTPPRFSVGGPRANQDPRIVAVQQLLCIVTNKNEIQIPTGWEKLHQYIYVKHQNTDDHGWQYRSDWSVGVLSPQDEQWVGTNADGRDVRRRFDFPSN